MRLARRTYAIALYLFVLGLFVLATTAHAQVGQLPSKSALSAAAAQAQDASDILAAAISRGGEIHIPAGTYRLTQTIVVDLEKTGVTAIQGSSATRIIMAAKGPAFRFVGTHFSSADPGGFAPQIWERERMPTLSGLAIEGDHPEADGIEASGTMQLVVSNVHLRNLRHGIHLLNNNRNIILEGCHIYENSGIGVFYDDVNLHQSNIVGCHISYCDGGGIVSRRGNVRNIHISACDIESNMSADAPPTANVLIDCRESDHGTAEVAISGCTIQHNDNGPESCNVWIIGRSNPTQRNPVVQEGHVTMTGNVLSDVHTNIRLQHCRGVTLTGNTFWMGFEHNLLVEDSSHIVLGSNNFDRNPRYDYGRSLEAKNRLIFRNCSDSNLSGVHIAHVWNSPAALTLDQCDRFCISGLSILDCDNVGLLLRQVTRSQIGNCLIRDDRAAADFSPLVMIDCQDNQIARNLLPAQ